MKITPESIESLTQSHERYFLPDTINAAVESCLDSDDGDAISEEAKRLEREYHSYILKMEPAKINYRGAITLDAYTAVYLSRNFCIPLIGLRDLVYHPLFQNLPSSIKVLDIGSGTGAVVMGLLWLFSQTPLSDISVNIIAVDSCIEALNRQRDLIHAAGFQIDQVELCHEDICDTDQFMERLKDKSPFDLIFSANCFTETPESDVFRLVPRLPEILTHNGAIIIAEAQRNYTKVMLRALAENAQDMGLHVYYPCPDCDCHYHDEKRFCWVWRYHKYKVPTVNVDSKPLQYIPKGELVASWLILTKQTASIYDPFIANRPDLSWGPISKEKDGVRLICNEDGARPFKDWTAPL